VVHRDLKPHNIFLGENDVVKIGDFGVSRQLNSSRDMAQTVVGSPGYLSPELCNGEPYNEKADVWYVD
jgi:NIMA (never in mitosis gene a)-related kinase